MHRTQWLISTQIINAAALYIDPADGKNYIFGRKSLSGQGVAGTHLCAFGTTEIHCFDEINPSSPLTLVRPRREGKFPRHASRGGKSHTSTTHARRP